MIRIQNKSKQNQSTIGRAKQAAKEKKIVAKKQTAKPKASGAKGVFFRQSDILPELGLKSMAKEVQQIISAMAAPMDVEPIRFVSPYTSQSTAVAKPFEREDVGWGATYLPSSAAFGAVFRDPVRSAVLYNANAATLTSQYKAQFNNQGVLSSVFHLASTAAPVRTNQRVGVPIAYLTPTSSFAPHGPVLGVGVTSQNKNGAVYMASAAQDYVTITMSSMTAATEVTPIMYRWDGSDWEFYRKGAPIAAPGGAVSVGPNNDIDRGYFRFELENTSTTIMTAGDAAYDLIQSGGIFEHHCLPFLDAKLSAINEVRVNSYSLMLTNKASLLNLSGKIAAYQSPGDVSWDSYAIGGITLTSSANGAVQLDARNGIYLFGKPTMSEDFDYVDCIEKSYGAVSKFSYALDSARAFCVIYAQIDNTSGQDAYWTRSYGVEFLTQDQWFDVEAPACQEDLFRQALVLVRDLPAIHENPLHWSDIRDFAKKAANAVLKYGPVVMNIASHFV